MKKQCDIHRGEWIRKPSCLTTVVFVHGLLSNGESCWKNPNGSYWPELIKNESGLEQLGIYVYSYQTGFSSGSYSLNNVVDDLKERFFTLDKISSNKKIIFVCHSMGGIIVRKFIVERLNDLLDHNIEINLFLVASPSLGSDYANWLEPIAKFVGHSQVKALKFSQDNQWLNDLDKTFLNLKESGRLKITGKELLEDKFITLKSFFNKQIVEPFSGARYFGESFKVADSDHFSIAKPQDRYADQHRLLVKFITNNNFQTEDNLKVSESLKISRLAERLGTGLSTVNSSHNDELHKYIFFERIDLLDYKKGDFHSIRYLHIKNRSNNYSSFLLYVECSEKKCSFKETGTCQPHMDSLSIN